MLFPLTDFSHLRHRQKLLTSVELGPVMELGVAELAQKGREVPTDGHREHECSTDPEWSFRGWTQYNQLALNTA